MSIFELKGKCFGVRIETREDAGPLVKELCEDDGNWFDCDMYDALWLDEKIMLLKAAREFMKDKEND